ncbi:MAG: HAMP domain-containing sensor histidine kinase [Thermoanaerobacterales bacterium]|nr:HAMP domain-containing sensor histidine kinase [Thermoanaerobacterales bacterium]
MIKIKVFQNPEVKRLFTIFALLLIGLIIIALLFGLAGRYQLKEAIINEQAEIIALISEKYPEAQQDMIRQLKQQDRDAALKGKDILKKYGISSEDLDMETPLLQKLFYYNLSRHLLLVIIACSAFGLALSVFIKKQYSQLHQISSYAKKINQGDYSLDIRDNREGELSILKNEIYKITTMLKKQAQALHNDKVILADSIADISHQLKTPLTSLSVLTDLLSENPSEQDKHEFLNRMRSQLKRIEWLVSSLLKISKLDAGTVTMKNEDVYVGSLVEKALEHLSIPLDIKRLQVHVTGEKDVKFTGDFNWSCEAIINIIKNCIEHTPEQGQLNISFAENPLYTVITIRDSGPGIDKEDLPYIFNRFYKGKNTPEDHVGIGLAMAQAIIAKQGGDITVKSEKNRGTEFTIKFYRG